MLQCSLQSFRPLSIALIMVAVGAHDDCADVGKCSRNQVSDVAALLQGGVNMHRNAAVPNSVPVPKISAIFENTLLVGDSVEQAKLAFQEGIPPALKHGSVVLAASAPSTHTQAVLGMACRYRKKHMAVFVKSLRATGYQGSIVLGVDKVLDEETLQFLSVNKVTTHSEPCIEQEVKIGEAGAVTTGRLLVDLCFSRYRYYKKWITQGKFTDAWLLGVKDVFFQTDPFSIPTPALGFFAMAPSMPKYEASQIEVCFGSKLKSDILKHGMSVMCGDTIVGNTERLLNLCDNMSDLYKKLKSVPGCSLQNDQPALNALVFQYGNEYAKRHALHEGPALTAWSESKSCNKTKLRTFGDGIQVLNNVGKVVPVIHMWMGCPAIRSSVSAWMEKHGFKEVGVYQWEDLA